MHIPQHSTKAFTLVELIVVIVILGLLALIAIPTFGKVVANSQDESTLSSLRAMARNAQALKAIDNVEAWGAHPEDAITETSYAMHGGILAATPYKASIDKGVDPQRGEVTYKVYSERLVLATVSPSTRICMIGLDDTALSKGTCVGARSDTTSSDKRSTLELEVASDNGMLLPGPPRNSPSPTPTTTPPSSTPVAAPTNLATTPLLTSVDLTWTPPVGVTGYTLKIVGGGQVLDSSYTAGDKTATVDGLVAGTSYTAALTSLPDNKTVTASFSTERLATTSYGPFVRTTHSPVAIADNFNRYTPGGTNSLGIVDQSTTPGLNPAWQVVTGDWILGGSTTNGAPYATVVSGVSSIALQDLGTSDHVVHVGRPNPDYTGSPGITFRYQDASNYWYAYTHTGVLSLYRVQGGLTTEVTKTTVATSGSSVATMHVETNGTSVKVWMGTTLATNHSTATPKINYTAAASDPNGTGVGLYTEYGTYNRRADNFSASPYGQVLLTP